MTVQEKTAEIIADLPAGLADTERMKSLFRRQEREQGFVARHALQVAETARQIAMAMSLDKETANDIYIAGCWHDIGKLAIPNEILLKPGALTNYEFEVVRQHTAAGMMLIGSSTKKIIKDIVQYHHERYDGHGYYGLKGDQIPVSARITAIADVHTALIEERSYKPGLPEEQALLLMTQNNDSPNFGRRSFDPDLLRFFVAMRIRDAEPAFSKEAREALQQFSKSDPVPDRIVNREPGSVEKPNIKDAKALETA